MDDLTLLNNVNTSISSLYTLLEFEDTSLALNQCDYIIYQIQTYMYITNSIHLLNKLSNLEDEVFEILTLLEKD